MARSRLTPAQTAGILIMGVITGFLVWFWYRPGVWSKMAPVVYHNFFFYFLMFGGVVYAFWRRHKNPAQFVWGEVPVQVIVSSFSLLVITHFFFYYGSELKDLEVWNGYVAYVEHQEEHDDEACTETCDEDGNNCTETCTCSTYPPSWTIYTNNKLRATTLEFVGTAPSTYKRYVSHFGNERRTGEQGDSCAGNPGYIWRTEFKGQPEKLVPTAVEHDFVNYLKASDSIRKTGGGNTEGFEEMLKPYPRVYGHHFGNIYLRRVLDPGNLASQGWKQQVDAYLDNALSTLGKEKEVNILVYLVNTSDQAFLHALEAHWVKGKKNDVVVIIGAPRFPEVSWVEIMSWDEGEEFEVQLKRRITKMENITNGGELARNIVTQVALPPEQGGFDRMEMDKLGYLAADVEIAFWAQLMILFIYAFLTWLTSWALENNEIRDAFARPFNRRFGNFS